MNPICFSRGIRIIIPLGRDLRQKPIVIIHQQYSIIFHDRISGPPHARAREQREGEHEKCGGYTAPREGAKPLEERSSDA